LFSQVLRLLAAEGMVSLGTISLDGTKLAGNAETQANRTLPQIDKLLAEAAKVDTAEDAQYGVNAERQALHRLNVPVRTQDLALGPQCRSRQMGVASDERWRFRCPWT